MSDDGYIYITFSNGDRFRLPKRAVAEPRAEYYASVDHDDPNSNEWQQTFNREVKFALKEDYELKDWLKNNMNWSDIEDEAEKVDSKDVDYADEFLDAEVEVD
jgi:hypothetical protein